MKKMWEKILDDESHHGLPSLTLAQYVGSIVGGASALGDEGAGEGVGLESG